MTSVIHWQNLPIAVALLSLGAIAFWNQRLAVWLGIWVRLHPALRAPDQVRGTGAVLLLGGIVLFSDFIWEVARR